jgi:hypothetical protein
MIRKNMKVQLGRWNCERLGRLLDKSSNIIHAGERVAFLSGNFLDTPYEETTLIGDMNHDEELVINLEGVDCLTFLEYIEALRLSSGFSEFEERLRGVRYRYGRVSYQHRNHFFTDWLKARPWFVHDVTVETGGGRTKQVLKMLNSKEDGTLFVPGIEPAQRKLAYIPRLCRCLFRKTRSGRFPCRDCLEAGGCRNAQTRLLGYRQKKGGRR